MLLKRKSMVEVNGYFKYLIGKAWYILKTFIRKRLKLSKSAMFIIANFEMKIEQKQKTKSILLLWNEILLN